MAPPMGYWWWLVSLINEYTEHVNLTPEQATELAYVLLTLAGRRER